MCRFFSPHITKSHLLFWILLYCTPSSFVAPHFPGTGTYVASGWGQDHIKRELKERKLTVKQMLHKVLSRLCQVGYASPQPPWIRLIMILMLVKIFLGDFASPPPYKNYVTCLRKLSNFKLHILCFHPSFRWVFFAEYFFIRFLQIFSLYLPM